MDQRIFAYVVMIVVLVDGGAKVLNDLLMMALIVHGLKGSVLALGCLDLRLNLF